jgi:glycosyltransferase involved in cell wall biosynthesis
VCSAEDARLLRELYQPVAPLVVIPNAVRLASYDAVPRRRAVSGATPLTVLFMGMYSYIPNRLAAEFLIREVFPRLCAACDDCRLILVGAMPTDAMRDAAARDARISVTGLLYDVREQLAEATVMAVPLFQGSGTRLKILEAFAARLPVVSTRQGSEGLDAQPATHLLRAETANEFAAAILRLWRNPDLAERLAGQARALVAERFSWTSVETRVRAAIGALLGDA